MDHASGRGAAERRAKGTNLIELVKALRAFRRLNELRFPSTAAAALVEERILPTSWYAHDTFVELLQVTYEQILRSDEQSAYEMGLRGGRAQLLSVHKFYVAPGDPQATLLALRHPWRSMFNFGSLTAEADTARSVVFTLQGYADVPVVHAAMIVGWGAAGGQLAGAPNARGNIVARPWKGDPYFRYRISF